MALASKLHQVLLYGYTRTKRGTLKWNFIGKCNSHAEPIVGLQFGESPAGHTRLFSAGSDGRLVEYDIEASQPQNGIHLVSAVQVCVGKVPTALSFGPPRAYYDQGSTDTELILAGKRRFDA